jgi:hypothetical protein
LEDPCQIETSVAIIPVNVVVHRVQSEPELLAATVEHLAQLAKSVQAAVVKIANANAQTGKPA